MNYNSILNYKYCSVLSVMDINHEELNNFLLKYINKDQNTESLFLYAHMILKWKNVPEFIMVAIKNNPKFSYEYIKYNHQDQNNVSEFIKSICKDPEYSYYYARNFLKCENVPQEIINGISQSSEYSYDYAKECLKGENVPQEIINGISQSSEYSYYYAKECLKGENVPQKILDSINNSSYATGYSIFLENKKT